MAEPASERPCFDVDKIRRDFPILSREVYGKPLVYLDNAASAQKPKPVLDAIMKSYTEEYANVHRGLHFLSNAATQSFEDARESVRRFLNAPSKDQIDLHPQRHRGHQSRGPEFRRPGDRRGR